MSFYTRDILCTRNYMRSGLVILSPCSRLILKAMLSGNRGKEMLFVNRRRTKRKGNLQVGVHFMTRLDDVSRVRYVLYHNPATLRLSPVLLPRSLIQIQRYMTSLGKRKQDVSDDSDVVKKPKPDQQQNELSLLNLLDFTLLTTTDDILARFDVLSRALLHDFHLVVRYGTVDTPFEILELEFYLQKAVCHEDPFTHGSEEQKVSGRWYVL
jgi:hypothetical protein